MKILSHHTTMAKKCKRKFAIVDVFSETFLPLVFFKLIAQNVLSCVTMI